MDGIALQIVLMLVALMLVATRCGVERVQQRRDRL